VDFKAHAMARAVCQSSGFRSAKGLLGHAIGANCST
jgi:hypothetical protein